MEVAKVVIEQLSIPAGRPTRHSRSFLDLAILLR